MPAVDTGTVLLIVAVAVEGLSSWSSLRCSPAEGPPHPAPAAREARGRPGCRREAAPAEAAGADPDEFVKGVWETANLVREKGFGGAIRTSIEDLAGWAQVERPALVSLAGPDGSVAILFSDIEGSTALNERLGDKEWVKLLARHDAAVRSAIDRHDGHVVKTQGDGFMAAFRTPGAGRPLRDRRCSAPSTAAGARARPPVRVRIGIHHGDVVHRDNDIFGRNVAQAARVAALAAGGEILVSESRGRGGRRSCDDIVLTDPREVELKGLAGEHLVSAVEWTGRQHERRDGPGREG